MLFPNPLLPAPSQDPWVTRHHNLYLALVTDGQRIFLRCSADLLTLFQQPPTRVWTAPRRGPNAKHLWAPELHRLGDGWYIYYAADNGLNRNHCLWALASTSDDPSGPYRSAGPLDTGGFWAIDATILPGTDDQPYLLWSGWAEPTKGDQNLYLAPLRDPLTLRSPRVLLARPDQPWEQGGGAAICEGPAVLQRGGTTCVVYSAGPSWTVHSCLGMLVHRGGDYLDPAAWTKHGPVFSRTPEVWGIGHCSLVPSPSRDGGTIFYHAKTKRSRGWRDRNVRAQSFTWEGDLPRFGLPTALPNRNPALAHQDSSSVFATPPTPATPAT